MLAVEESKPNRWWLKKLNFCDPYRADFADDSDGDETISVASIPSEIPLSVTSDIVTKVSTDEKSDIIGQSHDVDNDIQAPAEKTDPPSEETNRPKLQIRKIIPVSLSFGDLSTTKDIKSRELAIEEPDSNAGQTPDSEVRDLGIENPDKVSSGSFKMRLTSVFVIFAMGFVAMFFAPHNTGHREIDPRLSTENAQNHPMQQKERTTTEFKKLEIKAKEQFRIKSFHRREETSGPKVEERPEDQVPEETAQGEDAQEEKEVEELPGESSDEIIQTTVVVETAEKPVDTTLESTSKIQTEKILEESMKETENVPEDETQGHEESSLDKITVDGTPTSETIEAVGTAEDTAPEELEAVEETAVETIEEQEAADGSAEEIPEVEQVNAEEGSMEIPEPLVEQSAEDVRGIPSEESSDGEQVPEGEWNEESTPETIEEVGTAADTAPEEEIKGELAPEEPQSVPEESKAVEDETAVETIEEQEAADVSAEEIPEGEPVNAEEGSMEIPEPLVETVTEAAGGIPSEESPDGEQGLEGESNKIQEPAVESLEDTEITANTPEETSESPEESKETTEPPVDDSLEVLEIENATGALPEEEPREVDRTSETVLADTGIENGKPGPKHSPEELTDSNLAKLEEETAAAGDLSYVSLAYDDSGKPYLVRSAKHASYMQA